MQTVEITGSIERRQIERVGERLVPGTTVQYLVLRFPNGEVHLAQVSEDALKTYLTVEAEACAEDPEGLEKSPGIVRRSES